MIELRKTELKKIDGGWFVLPAAIGAVVTLCGMLADAILKNDKSGTAKGAEDGKRVAEKLFGR